MLLTLVIILALSFVLALISMKDFQLPKEVRKKLCPKTKKGTIVFFKNKKTKHYY
jgi:hypothetical protein